MHNILIVDDESGIRDSLAGILAEEGYAASTVDSGEACLDLVRKVAFDVVLLDIWLPGIDGLETLERIRAFDVAPRAGGQPMVAWRAVVRERDTRTERAIDGHVEVRWSHGRFAGRPEAKVYLDTPHADVPGYFSLK